MVEYKNYAKIISEELHLDYDKVLNMTLSDINKCSSDAFEKTIASRMSEEDWRKILSWLIPEYDFFYEHLGEALIRAFCLKEHSVYLSKRTMYDNPNKYDDDEEKKRLLIIDPDSYRPEEKILDRYRIDDAFQDAICIAYPEIIKYSPEFSSYGEISKDMRILFRIKVGTLEDGRDDLFRFECSLYSFLSFDKGSIIEDMLDFSRFNRIKSREDEKFISINNFFNSGAAKEFFNIIENIKEKKENVSP